MIKSTKKAKELKIKLTQMVLEEIKKSDLSKNEIKDVLNGIASAFEHVAVDFEQSTDLDEIIKKINISAELALSSDEETREAIIKKAIEILIS